MVNKELAEKMRSDEELQELRRQVYKITGRLEDVSFCLGGQYTPDEWKEHLREIVRKQKQNQ